MLVMVAGRATSTSLDNTTLRSGLRMIHICMTPSTNMGQSVSFYLFHQVQTLVISPKFFNSELQGRSGRVKKEPKELLEMVKKIFKPNHLLPRTPKLGSLKTPKQANVKFNVLVPKLGLFQYFSLAMLILLHKSQRILILVSLMN